MLTTLAEILTIFVDLPDPRQQVKVEHKLHEMIFIALCAAIADCNYWTEVELFALANEDWFREHLELENGVPSHDTFSRVFAQLDTAEFALCLQKWIDSLQLTLKGKGVHLDGKTLRRSFDKATGKGALQVVSAWVSDFHLCLGQRAVAEGSDERAAVADLLEILELTDAVVTLDALHCQRKTAKQIRAKNADYVLIAKKNQPTLRNTIRSEIDNAMSKETKDSRLRRHRTVDRKGSRVEEREYTVYPAPKILRQLGWTDVQTVGMVRRKRTDGETVSEQTRYFISSLSPRVREVSKHLRDHWKVENQLHWSLDVTFAEDLSRIRKGNGQEITSMFRRLALSILKRDTSSKASLRSKRKLAGWDLGHLTRFLTGKAA